MIGPKPENCDEALESVKNEGAQETVTKEPTPQGPPVFWDTCAPSETRH